MEGDLTLQLLVEASVSGLLRRLDIDPRNLKSLIQLKSLLVYLRDERDRQYEFHELLASMTVQVCMAIGNRDAYPDISKATVRILKALRSLVRPDLHREGAEEDISDYQKLMNMWREKFGDPDKAEQREREQRIEQAAKQKAAAPAEQVSGIHNTEEFIRKRLFR